MTPLLVVIGAHPRDVAPSRSFVPCVEMVIANSLWAEINGGSGKNAVVEVPGQRRIAGVEAAEFVDIFLVQFGCISCECT
jgi:hypothetical protein